MAYDYPRVTVRRESALYMGNVLGATNCTDTIVMNDGLDYHAWLLTLRHEQVHFHYKDESRVRELCSY